MKQVFDFIENLDNKKKYENNYDSGTVIKIINEFYSLQYVRYKGKLGSNDRDFTLISKKNYGKE